MGKMHEIAAYGAPMPRFDGGMVNMAELIRAMAESLVSEVMDLQTTMPAKPATGATAAASAGSPPAWASSVSGFLNLNLIQRFHRQGRGGHRAEHAARIIARSSWPTTRFP